ncbi:MAG: threonine synthase [Acidimicrobiales bacterium]|nr:MAG: threonine synthase [Acidimicrobiales bacterium]
MRYVSTRGSAPPVGFADVLLSGLAPDRGLYVPESWPTVCRPEDLDGLTYVGSAVRILSAFVGDVFDEATLRRLVETAYRRFDHPEVVPLRRLREGLWLMELFWGPTLAFKDLALQVVGGMFEEELSRRETSMTVLGATSGDTGSAAIEACRDRAGLSIFVLHPHGRVSEIQRRQMTTVLSDNVHNLAVRGTFDDCQAIVKTLFADEEFASRARLGSVNSINWARIAAQVVYYARAATRLSAEGPVTFVVPTGNFGNVFAAWVARRCGAPIGKLVVASNSNDVLPRWLESGVLEKRDVVPTLSPSMDIQVSSNLERLLFEASGRDGEAVAELLGRFEATGRAEVPPPWMDEVRELFDAERLDDVATVETIAAVHRDFGIVVDPHTAVGVGVAETRTLTPPVVVAATAHPAKFPEAVERAIGVRPELPPRLADLTERPERMTIVDADATQVRQVIEDSLFGQPEGRGSAR